MKRRFRKRLSHNIIDILQGSKIRTTIRYFFIGSFLFTSERGYRMFSHDVTTAILVFQNYETAAMLVSQSNETAAMLVSQSNETAAMLVSQSNETAAMLVSQTSPLIVELFSYANAFFCYNKFAYMLAT